MVFQRARRSNLRCIADGRARWKLQCPRRFAANLLQANRPALAAVFAYVPTSQVQLGSDYPFGTSTDGIRGLEEYGLKPSDLDAIYHGNAECLLPRLRSKAHERI
jgi:predicted TIM-barrel fold metal-dependent hydrolase